MDTTKATEYLHKDLIAWVSYPPDSDANYCFVYPQYLFDSGKWEAISAEAFPNNGCFHARITNGNYAQDLEEKYRSIVVARINADWFDINNFYDVAKSNSTYYTTLINPNLPKRKSQLEFDVFSNNPFSADLLQIVKLENDMPFSMPIAKPVAIIDDTYNLVCRFILVKDSSGKYFGPFEYEEKDEAIVLVAPSVNDYRIACFDSIDDNIFLKVKDEYGIERCVFAEKHIIDSMLAKVSDDNRFDWMPQKELVNFIIRAIKISDDFNSLSKGQLRNIKSAIWNFNDDANQIQLDEQRIQKIIDWLSEIDNWTDLPEQVIQRITESIDEEKLLDIVLDEQNFPLFKNKIMKSAEVRDSINEEKKNLEASLVDIRKKRDELKKEKINLENSIRETELKAEEASKAFEKVQKEALGQKRDELDELEREIEERKTERDNCIKERDRAIVEKKQVEDAVNDIIYGINNEVETSTKILESELLRKVVTSVSNLNLRREEDATIIKYGALRSDENEMSDDDVVDVLFESITQRAGRQITRNDTINLMICLTQGYITTFAGLPGTGKTSLCNIMASALGLTNDEAGRRFTEINVENGWTSYKDYVGYYNPLAKTYETANTSVYEAMRLLSKEDGVEGDVPPYIFLLDEANLSPIEHYWAPFLRTCDNFQEAGTPLSLGGEETWYLPSYVRFLATVNFDYTTEALSRRFLDRSWVVTLDPIDIDLDFEQISIENEFASESAFSSKKIFQTFGFSANNTLDQDNASLFEELIQICRSHSYAISPRSQLMMKHYLATASRLMSLQLKDSQYAPLDYAFSQKMLPQITGPAESVGELINDLIDKCSQLETTRKQLERMKEFGEDSGFFQYFI